MIVNAAKAPNEFLRKRRLEFSRLVMELLFLLGRKNSLEGMKLRYQV